VRLFVAALAMFQKKPCPKCKIDTTHQMMTCLKCGLIGGAPRETVKVCMACQNTVPDLPDVQVCGVCGAAFADDAISRATMETLTHLKVDEVALTRTCCEYQGVLRYSVKLTHEHVAKVLCTLLKARNQAGTRCIYRRTFGTNADLFHLTPMQRTDNDFKRAFNASISNMWTSYTGEGRVKQKVGRTSATKDLTEKLGVALLPGERVNSRATVIDVTNFTGTPQQLREVALAAKAITVRQRTTVRLVHTVRPPKPLKAHRAEVVATPQTVRHSVPVSEDESVSEDEFVALSASDAASDVDADAVDEGFP
jgi:hypothetical protein